MRPAPKKRCSWCAGATTSPRSNLWSTVDPVRPEGGDAEARVNYPRPFLVPTTRQLHGLRGGMPSLRSIRRSVNQVKRAPIAMLFTPSNISRQAPNDLDRRCRRGASVGPWFSAASRARHAGARRVRSTDSSVRSSRRLRYPRLGARAVLSPPGTDPILVEIVAAFSGEASGVLDLRDASAATGRRRFAYSGCGRNISPFPEANRACRSTFTRLMPRVSRRGKSSSPRDSRIPGVALIGRPDLRRAAVGPRPSRWRLGHAAQRIATPD